MKSRLRRVIVLAATGVALLAGACGGIDTPDPRPPVFAAAPWEGPERLLYELKQRDYVYGRCTLETVPEVEPGVTQLNRLCQGVEDEQFRDDATVLVDSRTLAPLSAQRINTNMETGERVTRTADYPREGGVIAFQVVQDNGKTNRATREMPEPTEAVPIAAVYEDEALFWLVRGLPLADGYEAEYTTASTMTVRVFNVEVAVEGREQVTVPAGTFEAWNVRIKTSAATNRLWVEVAPPRRIVKANIEFLTYELVETE
ncbi:MAG: hypothetical protein Kow0010_10180 [Dehalococcoidia bacterium]